MGIFDQFGLTETKLIVFVSCVALGALLGLALFRLPRKPRADRSFARPAPSLSGGGKHLALGKEPEIARALLAVRSHATARERNRFAALLTSAEWSADVDAKDLIRQLVDSIFDNREIARQIGLAFFVNKDLKDPQNDVRIKNLKDPDVRKKLRNEIVPLGHKLDLSFWNRHGSAIGRLGFPANLMTVINTCFSRLGSLKQQVTSLQQTPSEDDLIKVLSGSIEALRAFEEFRAIIESHASAGPIQPDSANVGGREMMLRNRSNQAHSR